MTHAFKGSPPPLASAARSGQPAARWRRPRVQGAARRAARATRSSSTCGRRGAGRASRSSRSTSGRRWRSAGKVAFLGIDAKDSERRPRRVPAHASRSRYPSYTDPQRRDPGLDQRVRGVSADVLLQPPRDDGVRQGRPVPERRRARSTTSASTCTSHEWNRRCTRSAGCAADDEMDAALELRHDVFCVEQGVPRHEELDGRDHEGLHLVAVADGELLGDLPAADGRPDGAVQPARGARRRRAGGGSRPRCSSWPSSRPAPPARAGSCCTPRPTRRSCTSRPGTGPAGACSSRPGSSTSRWSAAWL